MKVLVIGGTGAFGARVCDLLARDGHDVTIASRHKPVCTKSTGGGKSFVQNRQNGPDLSGFAHLIFDRNGDLSGLSGHDVIVDAAGPFHAYGNDPYRIPKAAIATGAHYFDLCDNSDFCKGISVLNDAAKAAGVCIASGMSSVPAISSAVVEALRDGQPPLMIETAILPGNKAPRGRAVVESILHQAGHNYVEKQSGRDVFRRSWSDPKTYVLGRHLRQGWRIEVPDQRLFPAHFNCPTVAFRAGLELGIMRYGLGAFSRLRGWLGFGLRPWMVSAMMMGARALAPFGTDTGGMVVQVTLPQGPDFVRKSWTMWATNGDGPYTPAIAVRAACRDLSVLRIGAGPAVALIPLDRIEACFADLDIETETQSTALVPAFKRILGAQFDALPPAVKATHSSVTPLILKGKADVTRGTGMQARIAAALFGFPSTTRQIDVEVTKTPDPRGETWVRRFGSRTFRSYLRPTPRGMSERFGLLTFDLDLNVADNKLHFPVKSGRVLGVPIPRALLPQSIATEAEVDGRFHFDVLLKAPTGATLVHYKGWLEHA